MKGAVEVPAERKDKRKFALQYIFLLLRSDLMQSATIAFYERTILFAQSIIVDLVLNTDALYQISRAVLLIYGLFIFSGQGQAPPPGANVIQVTPEERESINRVRLVM